MSELAGNALGELSGDVPLPLQQLLAPQTQDCELHRGLVQVLAEESARLRVPREYWVRGGCLILSDAFVTWSAGAFLPGGSRSRLNGRTFLNHSFVWRRLGGRTYIADGLGVHTPERYLEGLRLLLAPDDRLPVVETLQEDSPASCHVLMPVYEDVSDLAFGVPRLNEVSESIAQALSRRLGAYYDGLLPP